MEQLRKNNKFFVTLSLGLFFISIGCSEKSSESASPAPEEVVKIEMKGINLLESGPIEEGFTNVEWDSQANYAKNISFLFGFTIDDTFTRSLDDELTLPIDTQDIDSKVWAKSEENFALGPQYNFFLVAQVKEFDLNDSKVKRFSPVSMLYYNTELEKFIWPGDKISTLLHRSEKLSKPNKNQIGNYFVFTGKHGFAGAKFKIASSLENGKLEPLVDALIQTPKSPFLTRTDLDGNSFFVHHFGASEPFFAIKKDFDLPGYFGYSKSVTIPVSRLGEIATIANARLESATALEATAKYADKVLDLGIPGATFTEFNATLRSPTLLAPANTPSIWESFEAPTALEGETVATANMQETKTELFHRGDINGPQKGLGCSSKDSAGNPTFIESADSETSGWRFMGNAGSFDAHYDSIFQSNQVDGNKGYCMLSTDDGLYKKSGNSASIYNPIDKRVTEIWQKVLLPDDVLTFRARIAVLTQEYPLHIGTSVQDMFWMKFDEDSKFLVSGTLNQIAEVKDDDSFCQVTFPDGAEISKADDTRCGRMNSTYSHFNLGAEGSNASFFSLSQSTQTLDTEHGTKSACSFGPDKKACFSGIVTSRNVCTKIPEQFKGKTVTLRIGVGDGGDSHNSTALLIDTIAFSGVSCSENLSTDDPIPNSMYQK